MPTVPLFVSSFFLKLLPEVALRARGGGEAAAGHWWSFMGPDDLLGNLADSPGHVDSALAFRSSAVGLRRASMGLCLGELYQLGDSSRTSLSLSDIIRPPFPVMLPLILPMINLRIPQTVACLDSVRKSSHKRATYQACTAYTL